MPGRARFPVSDHCDGEKFFNPVGQPQAKSFSSLPKWWFQQVILGRRIAWPKELPPQPLVNLPAPIAPGEIAATFIGHATYLLQWRGLNVLTDPIFSDRASPVSWAGPKRARPPALALAELPRIDVVLLSHNHYDHLDLPALQWLAREHRPQVVTTLGNRAWLAARSVPDAVELDWWQTHHADAGWTATGTPAQHFAARWPWDRCRTLWGGFAFEVAGTKIYFTGDSGYSRGFAEIGARLGPFDLSLLPIGAYAPRWFLESVHMNPAEAVRVHREVRSRQSLAMHHGTFQLTDEGIDAPLHDLADARAAAGVPAAEFHAPAIGETYLWRTDRSVSEV